MFWYTVAGFTTSAPVPAVPPPQVVPEELDELDEADEVDERDEVEEPEELDVVGAPEEVLEDVDELPLWVSLDDAVELTA